MIREVGSEAIASSVMTLMARVRAIVIDEADQLYKSDFKEQIDALLTHMTSMCFQVPVEPIVDVAHCGYSNGDSEFATGDGESSSSADGGGCEGYW